MYGEMFIINLIVLAVVVVFLMILLETIMPSKTKTYRRDLSNMYVVGKIKQIADKEGINLIDEFAEFAKVTKNKKIDFESIDNTIEREMEKRQDVFLTPTEAIEWGFADGIFEQEWPENGEFE